MLLIDVVVDAVTTAEEWALAQLERGRVAILPSGQNETRCDGIVPRVR